MTRGKRASQCSECDSTPSETVATVIRASGAIPTRVPGEGAAGAVATVRLGRGDEVCSLDAGGAPLSKGAVTGSQRHVLQLRHGDPPDLGVLQRSWFTGDLHGNELYLKGRLGLLVAEQ